MNRKETQDPRNQDLLEIYKIHAIAADDVSRRRDSANRMYLAATTAIAVVMGIAMRGGTGEIPTWIVTMILSVMGALIQSAWIDVINTYKQLNSCKFKVLHEIEEDMAYPFYRKEWEYMKQGQDPLVYKKMTVTEKKLPVLLRRGFWGCAVASSGWGIWTVTTMKCL